MRYARTLTAAALAAVLAAAALGLPSAMAGAASGPALPPSKYLGNCSGHAPVVVASDAAAQSDIYSAVTLAGALGSRCVVLAGPRGEAMPADQQRRLAAAASGGYVVGGLAAVPDWKVSGRRMVRISGADRWATAELVGAEAKRIGNGSPSTPKLISGTRPASTTTTTAPSTTTTAAPRQTGYKAIAAGGATALGDFTCAIRADDRLKCWGERDYPEGSYKAVTAGNWHSCAIRTDGGIDCWGNNPHGQTNAPRGSYTAVAAGRDFTCAIRASDSGVDCWGDGWEAATTQGRPRVGAKAIAAGDWHLCALRNDGELTCAGNDDNGQAKAPRGSYKAVTAGGRHSCAIRTDNTLKCWGDNSYGQTRTPSGSYTAVAAGWDFTCAIRAADGGIDCWGGNWGGISGDKAAVADAPEGNYRAVTAGNDHACAIRAADGNIDCWGRNIYAVTGPSSS